MECGERSETRGLATADECNETASRERLGVRGIRRRSRREPCGAGSATEQPNDRARDGVRRAERDAGRGGSRRVQRDGVA